MEIKDKYWCLGFFESQASFSVGIGFSKNKKKRYILFKPYIAIANTDLDQVEYIKKLLGLNYSNANKKKKKKESHNDVYSLNVQNINDIDKIIQVLSDVKFKSKIKQDRLDRFIVCYKHIKKIRHPAHPSFHDEWSDEFREVIKEKLAINQFRSNIDKNRFDEKELEKQIKEHLNKGVDDE